MSSSGNVCKRIFVIDWKLVNQNTLPLLQSQGCQLPVIDKTNTSKEPTLEDFPGRYIKGLVDKAPQLCQIAPSIELVWTVIKYFDPTNTRVVATLYSTGAVQPISREEGYDMNAATKADFDTEFAIRQRWAKAISNSKTRNA